MNICLLTEVKQQWAMLVLGWVTVWVLDQLWDVSQLEFLCVTRLSEILVHYSCFRWLCARARGWKHLSALFHFCHHTFMNCGIVWWVPVSSLKLKQQWATSVLEPMAVWVPGKVWDVSDSEFVLVTRFSWIPVHCSCLWWLPSSDVSALLMALWFAPIDRKTYRSCLFLTSLLDQ